MNDELKIEKINCETEEYVDNSLYNIISYGTDINVSQIVSMYEDGDIIRPDLQRNFVWNLKTASRFIDSILLGLPVPSVFFAKDNDNRLLIVDGFQRITTITSFINESFNDKKFKLSNNDGINPLWRGKSYSDLSESQKRAIRMYSIHAIVFEQKTPSDDTGMYQVFERINTGGQTLKPQEIRNCVYHGPFNNLLGKLNKTESWRKILNKAEDPRMGDIELILRFFAFLDIHEQNEWKESQINLTKYLNNYMRRKSNLEEQEIEKYTFIFTDVMKFIFSSLGDKSFRNCKIDKNNEVKWAKNINPILLDTVCVATANYLKKDENNLKLLSVERYKKLLLDEEFISVTKERTTRLDNIRKRLSIAANVLFDIELYD